MKGPLTLTPLGRKRSGGRLRARGLAAALLGAALEPRSAARLAWRDHRAAVAPRRVALVRAARRTRRLEVEVQRLVDERLVEAVVRGAGHAISIAVDRAAVVEAV